MKSLEKYGCRKCESFTAHDQTMLGEVHVRLCAPCMNLWRDVCEVLPEFARVNELKQRVDGLIVAATGVKDPYDEIRPLNEEIRKLKCGPIRAAAEAWLAVTIDVDEPATK